MSAKGRANRAQTDQRVRETLHKRDAPRGEGRPVLGGLDLVEGVLIVAMVEDGVDRRSSHSVVANQGVAGIDQGPCPDADLWIRPQGRDVRHLEGDGTHVLVEEEVAL